MPLDQLYAKAVTALNRVVSSRDFESLPRITEALRAAAGALREDDPARAGVVNNLGSAAQLTYLSSGELDDLEDAIAYYRAACSSAQDDDPDLVLYLCNLALAHTDHATKTSDAAQATEAVRVARTAVELTDRDDPRRGTALVRHANALKLHARLASEPASDDDSIDVFREAVRSADTGGAAPADLLINLGSALLRRYERGGVPADLDEGISHLGSGVGQMADGDPRRTALCHLANALRLRFRQDGDLGDLDAALNELLGVLGVLYASHPLTGKTLWTLACMAAEHADSTGDPAQVRRVLRALGATLRGVAEDDPTRPLTIASFGALLRRHFLYGANAGALDTAVEAGEAALGHTTITDQHRCAILDSLASSLITRFEHAGDAADLDRATEVAEEAAELAANGAMPQYGTLVQLGVIRTHRFHQNSRTDELEAAVELLDRALQAMPETEPEHAAVATHLGRALQSLFQRTGRRRLYRWARRVYTEAAMRPTAPAEQRLQAASRCGRLAAQAHRWSEALESFSTAVELLPLVTRGKQVIASPAAQQRWAFIAADAAACALENGQPERAVELLEHGRGAILADFLPIGGELGALHRQQPELADQTVRLRRLLDRPPEELVLADLETARAPRDHLAEAWDRLLTQVRSEPGQRDHLRPMPFAELSAAGREGPVVLINLSRYRSDALVVFPGRVVVIPLPGVTPESAADQAANAIMGVNEEQPQLLADALDWLWRSITQPVLQRLKYLGPPAGERWPRLWWSVQGAPAFLPLHAAISKKGHCVLDRVVSSYTPTLRTLLKIRDHGASRDGHGLIVAGTGRDLQQAQLTAGYWPDAEVADPETEPADMLRLLARNEWVYVGEPSTQYPAHPASALIADRESPALSLGLVELGQIDLEHAEFGYLGRCATAVDTPSGAAVSLAGALQYGGFTQVIGTLWETDEESSAYAQAEVYAELTDDSAFHADNAGPALHRAAHKLRAEHPDDPARWAGFLHFGP
jgi:tetratricopeptide (TPR) repeat protein